MQRERERSTTSSATNKWTTAGTAPSDYTAPKPRSWEYLQDDPGPSRKNKPCRHYKTVFDGNVVSRSGVGQWAGKPAVNNQLDTRWAGQSLIPEDFGYEPWADMMKCLMADAVGKIPNAGLLTSFAEIGQIKSILPQGMKILKQLISGKGTAKDIANGHLLYSFGVKPLMKDIRSILDLVEQVQKRLNTLYLRNGKTVTLSQRRVTKHNVTRSLPSPHADMWNASQTFDVSTNYGVSLTGESVYTLRAKCSSKMRFSLDYTSTMLISQYLGLTSPLTVAWNLIPYSFLLQWFFDVESKVKAFEETLLPHLTEGVMREVILTDPTFSVTRTFTHKTKLIWNTNNGNVSGIQGPYSGLTINKSVYRRDLGFPTVTEAPWGFSINQFLLTLSLIEQKR